VKTHYHFITQGLALGYIELGFQPVLLMFNLKNAYEFQVIYLNTSWKDG